MKTGWFADSDLGGWVVGGVALPCFQENDEEYHLQLRYNEKEKHEGKSLRTNLE